VKCKSDKILRSTWILNLCVSLLFLWVIEGSVEVDEGGFQVGLWLKWSSEGG